VHSHFAHLSVTVTNLNGASGETDEVTHIIESALRSAGYKADASIDDYRSYEEAQTAGAADA
jgi:hypothetical protein